MLGTLDTRIKSAQDDLGGDVSVDNPLLLQEKFPGQPCAPRERGDKARQGLVGEGSCGGLRQRCWKRRTRIARFCLDRGASSDDVLTDQIGPN
jgi:hypothetical protein